MKVTLNPVRCYELLGPDRKVIDTLRPDSVWQGMTHLVGKDGALIVDLSPSYDFFDRLFPRDAQVEVDVIKATKKFSDLLAQPAGPSPQEGGGGAKCMTEEAEGKAAIAPAPAAELEGTGEKASGLSAEEMGPPAAAGKDEAA